MTINNCVPAFLDAPASYDLDTIGQIIRRAQCNGAALWTGSPSQAAIILNRTLFAGQGQLVGVFNAAFAAHRTQVGQVVVRLRLKDGNSVYFDGAACAKSLDEVSAWGRVDHNDMAQMRAALQLGFVLTSRAASEVKLEELNEDQALRLVAPGSGLRQMAQQLERARQEVTGSCVLVDPCWRTNRPSMRDFEIARLVYEAQRANLLRAAQSKALLRLSSEPERKLLRELRLEGLALVTSARIHGSIECEMYDEHPGVATFWTDRSVCITIEPCSLQQAQTQVHSKFVRNRWLNSVRNCALPSWADRLDLIDSTGQVVASARIGKNFSLVWQGQMAMTESEQRARLAKAAELESQACYEVAMADNFSTAASLRSQAARYRREVSIAQSIARVPA